MYAADPPFTSSEYIRLKLHTPPLMRPAVIQDPWARTNDGSGPKCVRRPDTPWGALSRPRSSSMDLPTDEGGRKTNARTWSGRGFYEKAIKDANHCILVGLANNQSTTFSGGSWWRGEMQPRCLRHSEMHQDALRRSESELHQRDPKKSESPRDTLNHRWRRPWIQKVDRNSNFLRKNCVATYDPHL